MPIAEGIATRLVWKANASGDMTSNVQANTATIPGASGGQILRRVASTLDLTKDTYESAEIRTDRQVADFRHGIQRVAGNLSGELSPATYFRFMEAVNRDTAGIALADSNVEFTSITADNGTSTFTMAGGNPLTEGYRVGDIIRFTNLLEPLNNNRNFMITGFSGTNNRVIAVTPAPTTMASDTSFNVTRPGLSTLVPTSGHVSRLFTFEQYEEGLDISRLFTECRVHGYRLAMPATGMNTIEIPVMGRGMQVLSGASAPYFTSPGAVTATGITAAVNGVLRASGTAVGVITGLQINAEIAASAPAVVGQNFVPDILLGRFRVTGQVTALFETTTLLQAFLNETEVDLLARFDATSAAATDAMSIYLPRIKFGGASIPAQGEGELVVTLPFQALIYQGTAPGVDPTTIRIHDTAAT